MIEGDLEIQKDMGYFRVYDVIMDVFNSGCVSFFYNVLGGYYVVKMGRM